MQLTPQGTSKNAQSQSLLDSMFAIRDDLNSQSNSEITQIIPGELSEAFAMLDPDLAMLHKDMQTASAQLAYAKKTGQLVDIATWRFESSESAYQTRLIEVRKNKLVARAASTVMDGDEEHAKRELHQLSMQERMNEQFAAIRKKRMEEKRRKEESQGGFLFYYLLGMWLANMQAQKRTKDLELSKVQNAFFNARTT